MTRKHTLIDNFIINLDYAVKTLTGNYAISQRPDPATGISEVKLSDSEKKLSAALMRINHAGEISAQGLYQGQALTASLEQVKEQMKQAAIEENDHLDWCKNRCNELNTHTSLLSPFWYMGSFTLGAIAGKMGDKWSLGFVAETEHQVVKHLDEHLGRISERDHKSRAILQQMRTDELNHAKLAETSGAAKLSLAIKKAMAMSSKIMTKTAFYI